MKSYKILLTLAVCLVTSVAQAQTGPGGVGTNDGTSNLQLWLRPDGMLDAGGSLASDGEIVATWADTSGYNHDAVTDDIEENTDGVPLDSAISYLNNKSGLLFDGDFPGNDGYVVQDINVSASEATVLVVATAGDFVNNVGLFVGYSNGNAGSTNTTTKSIGMWVQDDRDLWGRFIQSNGTSRNYSNTVTANLPSNDPVIITNHADGVTTLSQYVNGALANAQVTYDGTLQNYQDLLIGRQANEEFDGYIAEVIVFNRALNAAELVIVNNYLAAKYGITDLTDDVYVFSSDHGNEVSGIGQSGTDTHTSAQSGSLAISTPSSLGDGDYVLFGHDNADATTWTTTEQPLGDTSFLRLAREWRFDTTGTPGTVTVAIDTTDLPAKTTNFDYYQLWLDEDGDFSSGAIPYTLTLNGSTYEATGVSMTDGMFATISIYRPQVNFTTTAFNDVESVTPAAFQVNIPYAVYNNITIDYTTSGTSRDVPVAGSFTILAGSTSDTENVTITTGDATPESDHTIILNLTGAGLTGAVLGADSISTYTVNDDDNTLTIGFDAPFNYTHKKRITIDSSKVSGSTDLTDFPVMIALYNDTDLAANVQNANGYDIRFTMANSTTFLEHEIDYFSNAGAGDTLVAWVKIPTLKADVSTQIDMYYGNAAIASDPSTTGVWDDYYGVWHLGTDANDATSGGHDGTRGIGATSSTTSKIGLSDSFDGSNNAFINLPTFPNITSDMTISAWINVTDVDNNYMIFSDSEGSADGYFMRFQGTTDVIRMRIEGGGGSSINGQTALTASTWYYVVTSVDAVNNSRNLYLNDFLDRSQGSDPTLTANANDAQIGAEANTVANFDGLIDEVRVSRFLPSLDWVKTEFNNQNSVSTFYTVASQEAVSAFTVLESTDSVIVTVALSGISGGDISVDYEITGGTATNTVDYTLASGTATVTAGSLDTTFVVDIINDAIDEADETLVIGLSSPSAGANLSNTSLSMTITDDDTGPVIAFSDTIISVNEGALSNIFQVSLSAVSGTDVSVDYTVTAGTAVAGEDYVLNDGTLTISSGNTTGQLVLSIINDEVVEIQETFGIKLSNPVNGTLDTDFDTVAVTINDNDNFGIDGPGGVGDADGSGTLVLWVIGDSVSADMSDNVTLWANEVGISQLNLTPPGTAPKLVTNAKNGHSEVSFGDTNDALSTVNNLSASYFPYNEATTFTVSRHDNLTQQSNTYGTTGTRGGTTLSDPRFSAHMPWGGQVYFDIGTCCGTDGRSQFVYDAAWVGEYSILTWRAGSVEGKTAWRNYDQQDFDAGTDIFTNHSNVFYNLGMTDGGGNFLGDITEHILFTNPLNDAQVIIVNNYLAAKYDLTITNDIYAFDAGHGVEVAGIGREDATNFHTAAKSKFITISNASDLDDGEYVLFGHDNVAIDSWSTTDIPAGTDSLRRLAREWRFDITGSPGTISIAIDTSDLVSKPSGYLDYVVMTDQDLDFTSGATVYPATLVDGEYVANNVSVADGTYLAIGVLIRKVELATTSTSVLETSSEVITVSLNEVSDSDITLDYEISGSSTATQGSDYLLATTGSVTITAGSTSAIIDPQVVDESNQESDETIIVTLKNVPAGTFLGADSVFTYTITDDDNNRVVNFNDIREYKYKRELKIDPSLVVGGTDHVDFPVLVSITDDTLATTGNGGYVENTNGYDISFTLKDSLIWLDHDLEHYDATTGELVTWVRIPTLDVTDTTYITMYYGNSNITMDQSSANTWKDYVAVYHLSGDEEDSSPNGYDGVSSGPIDTPTSKIGRAKYFDGDNDVIALSSLPDLTTDFTMSVWIRFPNSLPSGAERLWSDSEGTGGNHALMRRGTDRGRFRIEGATDNFQITGTNGDMATDTWYMITGVFDSTSATTSSGFLYQNTTLIGTDNLTEDVQVNDGIAYLGSSASTGGADYEGFMDAFRIANVVRSADWISTEFANQNSPSTFVLFEDQQLNDSLYITEGIEDTVFVTVTVTPIDLISATSITYSAVSGTATDGVDFELTGGTLNIPAGERSASFFFELTNDLSDEADESFTLSLSGPSSNAKVGTNGSLVHTILDDDDGPLITFVDTLSTVNEGSSLITIPVQLNVASGNTVSVDYEVKSGTATSGSDYIALSGTLNISPGNLTNTISFQPIDDAIIEDPEMVVIRLFNPSNGSLGADSINTLTINDNDDLGFEGPGGVGDVENVGGEGLLKIWLMADSATVSTGTNVATWPNAIQNVSVDYDLTPASTAPDLIENQLNGHKIIRFNNANDALVSATLSAASFPSNEMTSFIVTLPSSLSQGSYVYATDNAETGAVVANNVSASVPDASGNTVFDLANDQGTVAFDAGWAGTHSIFTHVVSSDTFLTYRNNGVILNRDPAGNTFTGHTGFNFYVGKTGTEAYEGEIAEVIMFSRELNLAQTSIVNNYLAAKYNLTISNDIYNFDVTHGVEVAGIGRLDANNNHVAARAGVITISNASTLGDGDYVLFGHDNGDVSSWSSSEVPAASGVLRTVREWRFDTTGTPGTITIAIDTTLLPSRISGDEDYVVMVDADGNFGSGATIFNTTLVDGVFKASDIAIGSGDYVTIGILSRQIAFALTSSNALENISSNVEVTLSLVDDASIVLDYVVTGGTATQGASNDYTLATTGTVTFFAGQTSVNIPLGIINDSDLESDETIEITLRNPPAGVGLGADSVHTFTINDDDNTRKIQFSIDSITNGEEVDSVYIVAQINEIDASNVTKAYMSITGGSAESAPAPDYTFTADSILIQPNETTDSLLIIILNDVLNEEDETILLSLSSPVNAGLGDTATLVYTITDNDLDVVASFQDTTITSDEGAGVISVVVELDNVSGKDITVDYNVVTAQSTATGGGTDYSLADGSVVISAGDQFETINIALTDDNSEETAETLTIAISGDNVTLNNADTVVISISDNDANTGYYGPGGVGDSETNQLWLDATHINGRTSSNPVDGATVSSWTDNSGNGYVFTAAGTNPTYDDNGINLNPTISITAGQSGFNAPAGFSNGLSNYSIFSVVEQTSGQYLSEMNTSGSGNFRVNQGSSGLYAYNDTDYLVGNASSAENIMTWMFDISEASSTTVYRDGTSLASDNNYSVMSLSNSLAVGNRHQSETQANSDFVGNISEFIIYNNPVNEAQRIIVENYLGAKYGLTIANDLYDYEGTFSHDVIGIGNAGVLDQHLEAMSDSLFLLGSASDLDSGEFVFAGHDNGSIASWTATEAPLSANNVRRLTREWRIDTVGNPGTVVMKIDVGQLPTPLSDYTQYVLWTDTDGDFNNGSTLYQLDFSATSGLYVSDPVTIDAGTYVTLGIIKPIVEFTLSASDSTESFSAPKIGVTLNFSRGENVTVNYAATGGTASGSNVDYLLTAGTLTIPPGNTTADIDLGIIDDAIMEGSETIEITLSSPSSNISLGTTVTHIYTILDNESDNEVNFFYSDSTDLESTALMSPVIILTNTAQTDSIASDGTTYVEIAIQPGGTATYDSDFDTTGVFVSQQLFIPLGDSVVTFDINVTDDAIFEDAETVILRITSSNVNVGTGNEFTYTITDNDTQPKVQFSRLSAFGLESTSPVQIEVVLDNASGSTVEVDYSVTATTGTDGADFSLTDGTLTFGPGDTEESILLTINNDGVLEGAETIDITLASPTNATLDNDSIVFVYTILDDDNAGFAGPGGVGDATDNILWLRGDNYNGTIWSDTSGNDYDATILTGAPGQGTAINAKETVVFDGNDGIDVDAVTSVAGDYDVFVVYDADAGTNFTLFESVNGSGDTLALVHNGTSGGSFYDNNDAWIGTASNVSGTTAAIQEFKFQSGTGNAETKRRTTVTTSETSLTYTQTALSGQKSIGASGASPIDHYFSGDIAEVIFYNTILNTAQRKIVENYLGHRYGIVPETDLFDETGGFTEDLAGLGRDDNANLHTAGMSQDLIRVSDANALGDGDFLLFAHNDGSIASWVTTEQPNTGTEHLSREWKVDITGTPGTVTFTLDSAILPARSADFTTFALLVDGDGDFSTTDSIYILTNSTGSEFEVNNVVFSDGDFFTIAAIRNETNVGPAGGDFNSPGTWVSGVVPGPGESVVIADSDSIFLTQNTIIGDVVNIGSNAVLDLNGFTLTMDVGCFTLSGNGKVNVDDPGSKVEYARNGDQCVTGMAYNDLDLETSGRKFLLGDIVVNGDMNITDAGVNLDATVSDYQINIAGDWISVGSFDDRSGKVVFDGNAAQQINTTGGEAFNKLEVNKASGDLTFNSSVTIADSLNLASGDVILGINDLDILSTADIEGGSATSYIQANSSGVVRKFIVSLSDSLSLPVGDNDDYSPFAIRMNTATLGAGAAITINLRDATHTSITESSFITRFWSVNQSNISGTIDYDVWYSYTDADVSGTESFIQARKFSGSGDAIGGTIDASNNLLSFMGHTSFSDHTGEGGTPLPVTLVSISAELDRGAVVVSWATASEIDNDYFSIQRSFDGIDFEEVGTINGRGSTKDFNEYQFRDLNPRHGMNYYRLQQFDFDGQSEFSPVVSVNNLFLGDQLTLLLYPNPTNPKDINLRVMGLVQESAISLKLVNQYGNVFFIDEVDPGQLDYKIEPGIDMPSGIYYLLFRQDNVLKTLKLVIE